jgi:hypothetical protein
VPSSVAIANRGDCAVEGCGYCRAHTLRQDSHPQRASTVLRWRLRFFDELRQTG